jgi:hypothetical protein
MPQVEISEETHTRLERVLENARRSYPGYGHLTNTVDELVEAYCVEKLNHYDRMKEIAGLPFRPLHGR